MKKGFTIIETSLVVAISGLLAVGLMIGWSRNINIQRYNDSVETFKSDIQAVFDEVQNPTNTRVKGRCLWKGADSVENVPDNLNGTDRGASECMVLGKAIIFSNSSIGEHQEKFVEYDLVGKKPFREDYSRYSDSIDALESSNISILKNSGKEHSLAWGSKMKMATKNKLNGWDFSANREGENITYYNMIGVMVVRSPLDGSMMAFGLASEAISFTDEYNSNLLRFRSLRLPNMLNNDDRTVKICVISANNVYNNGNRVVSIGQSGAKILPTEGKGSMRCGNKSGKFNFDEGYKDIFFEGKPII